MHYGVCPEPWNNSWEQKISFCFLPCQGFRPESVYIYLFLTRTNHAMLIEQLINKKELPYSPLCSRQAARGVLGEMLFMCLFLLVLEIM
jgi:hypothetical protein